jgi:hypothetical protein
MGLVPVAITITITVPVPVTVTVTIVLVVFISPIAFGAPTLGIGVPPPMAVGPAIFASLGKLVTGVVGFGTAIAMVLDSFVESVVSAVNAFLAVVFISAEGGGCAECGKGREGCCDQSGFAEIVFPSMWQVHFLCSPCEDQPRKGA